MIDYGQFAERLARRQDRWSLLVEFQREWGFIGATNSFDSSAEEREGKHSSIVPAAFTEWCELAENSFMQASWLGWTHLHHPPTVWPTARLVDMLRAEEIPDEAMPQRYGVFMGEYEYCWTWSYREDEAAANPDPPVYITDTERGAREVLWDVVKKKSPEKALAARSISEWALAFAVTGLPFGLKGLLDEPDHLPPELIDKALVERHDMVEVGELTDEQRARVEERFPELGLLPWIGFLGGSLRGGPDVILVLADLDVPPEKDFELTIAARTPEALRDALAVIGIDPGHVE